MRERLTAMVGPNTVSRVRRLLLLGLLTLLPLLSQTQALLAQATNDPQWRNFKSDHGLLSNDVWSLHIDGDTVWIGTVDGIARYNGVWTLFTHQDAPPAAANVRQYASGLTEGVVQELAGSPTPGVLWAGADAGGITRWNGAQWEFVTTVDGPVHALYEAGGELFIGSADGVWRYDLADQSLTNDRDGPGAPVFDLVGSGGVLWAATLDGVWELANDRWAPLPLSEALPTTEISRLWFDAQQRLWVGTPVGVTWLDTRENRWSDLILPVVNLRDEAAPIQALVGDGAGTIWAGSNGGGARRFIDDGAITLDVARSSGGGLTTPLVRDIAIDDDGAVWFATPVGLFQYRADSWLNDYVDIEGLDRRLNAVNDLLVATDGSLWIGTAGAGVRHKVEVVGGFAEDRFNSADHGLPADGINALAEDADGAIWIGTFRGPARFADGLWSTPIDSAALPSPVVTALTDGPDGLWLGTEEGLVLYARESETLTQAEPLRGLVIEALAWDSLGRLWVGTAGDGIWIRAQNGQWMQMQHRPGAEGVLPGNEIVTGSLAPDPLQPGAMWTIVRGSGLVHFDGEQWTEIAPDAGFPSTLYYRVFADPVDGSIWVGAEAGLLHYDGRSWGLFTVLDGLQSTAIYAMARTPEGGYWFGGPEGLTYYRADVTPPWIRIGTLGGGWTTDGAYRAYLGDTVEIELTGGDLQTLSDDLAYFYRTAGSDRWVPLPDPYYATSFQALGDTALEFTVRDQSFNYSEVIRQPISIVPVPEVVNLPILGEVELGIFWTLVILGAVALLGFGYVSIEIVQNRLRTIDAINRGFNPYVSGEPVRDEELFFGRRELLRRIMDTLHNNSIMIHGERRIGKTTLLYQLANVLRTVDDPDYWFLPLYIDLEGTAESEFFHFLVEEIVAGVETLPEEGDALAQQMADLRFREVPRGGYSDRDFNHDLRRIIALLQGYGERHHPNKQLRLILLMDEMDVMSNYDHLVQQQLRRIFMRDFAATLGAVVAGIQISKEWDRVESPWYNLFNEIEVEPFTREYALELLIEPVRDFYSYDPDALEFILENSNGRPFRIQQYALEAVNHMLADGRRRIHLSDVEVAHQRIQSSHAVSHKDSGLQPAPGRAGKAGATNAQCNETEQEFIEEGSGSGESTADGVEQTEEFAAPPS